MPIRPRSQPKPRTGLLRHWTLWAWFALAVALSVGGVCLWRSGRWLVREDAFGHAKWAVVLAGESRDCERTDAAIRLLQEGRIDSLILSATRIFKNRYQSEFMIDYAVQQGAPRDRLFEFRHDAYSTQEEARLLVRQFRLQNLDTVLIITSSYHTARARRIFRKLAQGYPVVWVAAADYPLYDPGAWWSNRESRKIWFNEWTKTFFTAYELWRAHPETGKAEYQGLTPDPSGEAATPAATAGVGGRALADSAAHAAARKAAAAEGKERLKESREDSLKAEGRGAEKPGDSTGARRDSAQAVPEAKSEAKDTAAAEAARSGETAAPAAKPAAEAPKAAESKKTPSHAAAKKAVPASKTASKREEKKPEKAKKKG